MEKIATIFTQFPEKFGIPRQSGIVEELEGKIVFETPYRNIDAVRGLEGFSHIWLIWEFSANEEKPFAPTVRPPRLGGNTRMGVYATRSPFRPNRLGLSCVRLERIDYESKDAPVLHVSGADLMDGTPLYDIKPYVEADMHPNARFGFTENKPFTLLEVCIEPDLAKKAGGRLPALRKILANKPVPAYQSDPDRVYGMSFDGLEIKFRITAEQCEVLDIIQTAPDIHE
ncbi:MAG: tRNA (N6-threonylcarbamoyladenosine(37)-N6)-methyltransferase TrmO [Ruminococcaceae bacterium]|nr:tRNA (N6-threonylcarbamoyladenosine(37)-N6)-methyltransferase TrmO [Oscillospiraceae bacterium]